MGRTRTHNSAAPIYRDVEDRSVRIKIPRDLKTIPAIKLDYLNLMIFPKIRIGSVPY